LRTAGRQCLLPIRRTKRSIAGENKMLRRFNQFVVVCLSILVCSSVGLTQDNIPSPETIKRLREFQKRQKERIGDQMLLQQFMLITQNKDLMDDLEIIDDQRKDIEKVMQEYQRQQQKYMSTNMKRQQEIQKLYAAGQHEKAMQRGMDLQEQNLNSIDDHMDLLKEILLPHQMKRLKQISRQQSAKIQTEYYGFIGLPLAVADELELSAAEKKKLLAATKEADKQLRAELEKLSAKMTEKVLDALPREKREKYKELVGELYDSDRAMQKIRSSIYRRSRGAKDKKKEKDD
jgi:hypothetical protein